MRKKERRESTGFVSVSWLEERGRTKSNSSKKKVYHFLLEYKVKIDYNLKMLLLIIFIDKDTQAVWEDLQKIEKQFDVKFLVHSSIDLSLLIESSLRK